MIRLASIIAVLIALPNILSAQSAKPALTEDQYLTWNDIDNPIISNDGAWVAYEVNPAKGDGMLELYDAANGRHMTFPRGSDASFTDDSQYLVLRLSPPFDTVRAMKRKKTVAKDLPTDTLLILDLTDRSVRQFADLDKFQVPQEWSSHLFFSTKTENDTSLTNHLPRKAEKKEMVLFGLQLSSGKVDTMYYVTDYALAKKQPHLLVSRNAPDSTKQAVIEHLNLDSKKNTLLHQDWGSTLHIAISDDGAQAGYLVNRDTADARIAPLELYYWNTGLATARRIGGPQSSFLEDQQMLSSHENIDFTEDGKVMLFGVSPKPVLEDTTLLDDEIVKVEVWSHTDDRLFTQQEARLDQDRKESYLTLYRPEQQKVINLARKNMPEIRMRKHQDLEVALLARSEHYMKFLSWEGRTYRDVYVVNTRTGRTTSIATKISGQPQLSPAGKYAVWWEAPDSCWYAYDIKTGNTNQLSHNEKHPFYDELNDRPMHPSSYGLAGWTVDEHVLISDRFDIWKINPANPAERVNICNGRNSQLVTDMIRLDRDDPYVRETNTLVRVFDLTTKEEHYGSLTLDDRPNPALYSDDHRLDTRPIKAKNSDALIFTRESYVTYPDIVLSNTRFSKTEKISNANPQQASYQWGTIELVKWTDGEGIRHEGLLAKPEDFDPAKKYPMIVNFYERSSDGLHRHRVMNPGRSTISYPFYTSNGYVIFNPDIHYKVGHPGLSALEDVVSGTQHILDMGFVDPERVGLQGHSWGGYQIADIVSRTDMFACAESGAPVVNMISAYGGIRWGSGLSRMFQYEHTQSRLGGTLWEKPELYLENSPIFRIDQVSTPVLIMHNDEDTAVPWYQGIEFFVAMRRLGKPCWLLNYNGEPHWAVKWQNRLDFNKRMFQFFNHYLKDEPMPKWMLEGVPALEKGINQGYELIKP